MKKNLFTALSAALASLAMFATIGCSQKAVETPSQTPLDAIWIVNEGNFNASDAKITSYDPTTKTTIEDIFSKANNDAALGDIPTQITLHNNKVYIALSNSGKAYILNSKTAALEGKITGLHSPRYFAFISDTKGYISNLNDSIISVFDPSTSTLLSTFEVNTPVEQMIVKGDYVYANQWSYGTQLIKIDTKTDKVVDSIKVGIQPNCLFADAKGNFWTLCDGGYLGGPLGYDAPKIVRVVNLGDKMAIGNEFALPQGMTYSYRMAMGAGGDRIYYIILNKLYSMSIDATTAPTEPIATITGANLYSIAVNPYNGDVYVGDGVAYTQPGMIYRFDRDGKQLDKFPSGGVNPSGFLF